MCAGNEALVPVIINAGGAAILADTRVTVTVDQMNNCIQRYEGRLLKVMAEIVTAWVATLPLAAVLGGVIFLLLRRMM